MDTSRKQQDKKLFFFECIFNKEIYFNIYEKFFEKQENTAELFKY